MDENASLLFCPLLSSFLLGILVRDPLASVGFYFGITWVIIAAFVELEKRYGSHAWVLGWSDVP